MNRTGWHYWFWSVNSYVEVEEVDYIE